MHAIIPQRCQQPIDALRAGVGGNYTASGFSTSTMSDTFQEISFTIFSGPLFLHLRDVLFKFRLQELWAKAYPWRSRICAASMHMASRASSCELLQSELEIHLHARVSTSSARDCANTANECGKFLSQSVLRPCALAMCIPQRRRNIRNRKNRLL
jgi:hypothetical protein